MTNSPPAEDAEQRVERVLEEGLKRIDTPQAAHAVVTRLERLSAGQTEADQAQAAAQETAGAANQPAAAAELIEDSTESTSQILKTVAEQAISPTPAAEPVLEAAQAKLQDGAPASPRAQRGRRLLKDALLRRMSPLNGLDARIYLAVNDAPHPGALDTFAWALAIITTGGWVWVIGTLVAYLLRVPRSWAAVKRLLPSVVIATWLIEYPIKAFFRRRRPFVHIVRALVIGKKPGSWSFPSGHTGSSFASAWILSTVWPRRAPLFFGLASTVGLSRIYVGAHYPGDVATGAVLGMLLSETVCRIVVRLFR